MVDDLNNYDMVWALTQGTINAQLQWLFTKLTPPGQQGIQHVTFGQLFQADGKTVRDGVHVDAYLGVPSIEIAEGNDSTVYLYIPFVSGTLQHLGYGSTGVYTVNLAPDRANRAATTWTLCFKADINVADLTPTLDCQSGTPPANMHKETYQKLCNFQSSDFTIRQIFLDLQNVDMVTYLPNKSTIPANVTASYTSDGTTTPNQPDPMASIALQLAMPLYFKDLDASSENNPYILGYTANANFNQVSAFQPTGTVYSTHYYEPPARQPTDPDLSTFELLLVTHHKNPPLGNLGFGYNLVGRTGISGTGRVANATVVSDWLANSALPGGSVMDALGRAMEIPVSAISYDAATHRWSGESRATLADQHFAFITAKVSTTRKLSVTFSQSETDASGKTGPGLSVAGSFAARLDFDDVVCNGHFTRTQPFTMSIVMAPGIGSDGNATVTLSRSDIQRGKPGNDSDLGKLCKIPGIEQAVEAIMEDMLKNPLDNLNDLEVKNFGSTVDGGLRTLSSQIILPAPSVFAYKDIAFDDEFDLVTDFNYITQNQ
jgi:hypothetical protein